jgi:hypothetical protein
MLPNTNGDSLPLRKTSRPGAWAREHKFATVAAAFFLSGFVSENAAGAAMLGTHLFGIVSIFCDRSPWLGLLLFWSAFIPHRPPYF